MSGNFKCYPFSSTLPRLENCQPSSPSPHFQQKLVIASKYRIAVAIASSRELVAFRSTVAQNITNAIVDARTQTKVTALEQGEMLSIGLNADESFLGVFVNRQQGCFVLVYDILTLSVDIAGEPFALSTIRIGNSYSKGLAFEWNPTNSDMFAASDDEHTLSVFKVDFANPSRYSIVGEKKLDANIHEVSWSPKGKQLVVGDGLGRIFQMKPDLELVRMTNAPENAVGVKVVCLSWLSTTEWLVAYSGGQNTNTATFVLSIKKDKPPSWIPLDLPPQSSLGVTRRLLVDWNLALIAAPGRSQLFSLSRPATATNWCVTSLVSLVEPTTMNLITGIAISLSNAETCTIGGFSSRHLPSVMLLRSDGSVNSFWIAPPSQDYPDCYVSPTSVDVSMVRNGIRLSVRNSVTEAPISGTMALTAVTPPSVYTLTTVEPSSKSSSFNLFSSAPLGLPDSASSGVNNDRGSIATPSQLNITGTEIKGSAQKSSLFANSKGLQGAIASTAPSSSQKLVSNPPVVAPPFFQPDFHITESRNGLSTHVSMDEKTASEVKFNSVDTQEIMMVDVSSMRLMTLESVKLFLKGWNSIHKNSHSFYINLRNAARHVDEAIGSLSHIDNIEATDQIQQMVIELDDEIAELLYTLREKKNDISGKMESRKQYANTGLVLRCSRNLERSHYESVVQKYEDFVVKLHVAKRMIMEAKKISAKSKPRRLTDFDPKFDGRLQEGLKNLARYSETVRNRIAELERATSYFTSLNKAKSTPDPLISKESVMECTSALEDAGPTFIYSTWKPMYLQRSVSKAELRARLLEILKDKKDGKIPIKKINKLRFDCAPSDDTLSSSFLNSSNIETTLEQKINYATKIKSVVTMQNASVQADVSLPSQPPVSIVSANQTTTATNAFNSTSVVFDEKKQNDAIVATSAISTPSVVKSATDHNGVSLVSSSFSAESSTEATTCRPKIQEQRYVSINQKDVKQSAELQSAELGSFNQIDVRQLNELGNSELRSVDQKDVSQSLEFDNAGPETSTKLVFGSSTEGPPSTVESQDGNKDGATVIPTTREVTEKNIVKPEQGATVIPATREITEKNMVKPEQEPSTGVVTFSFKPKNTMESNQPVLSSHPFRFTPKSDSVTLEASITADVDADEGMDDDGGTSTSSQRIDSVFGGCFLSGIGSTPSGNVGKNVFGMGTSNLLKNTTSSRETSSIFSGVGNKSILSSSTQPSSFASAAQKAVQLDSHPQSTTANSVFGAAPKFGGPPIFGGKPVFGSTSAKPPAAFGDGSGGSGAFSAFSGTKNLFGSVSSGSSSVFGGGMSNHLSPKNTLFGGAQLNKSFSTWR